MVKNHREFSSVSLFENNSGRTVRVESHKAEFSKDRIQIKG